MNKDNQHIYDLCKNHLHAYVMAELNDGSKVDGIITGLDDEYVYLAVPVEGEDRTFSPTTADDRQFGYGFPGYGFGYGFPGYGYGPGFGHPPEKIQKASFTLSCINGIKPVTMVLT